MRASHKYASLSVRAEPMLLADKKLIRLKTLLVMGWSGLLGMALSVLVFFGVRTTIFTAFGKYEAFRHRNGWLFVVFGAVFSAAFIAALLYMVSRFYRAYLELTMHTKLVFSGSITDKRFTGRGTSKRDSGYHASLDGIEFTLKHEEYNELQAKGKAEFHCTFPGDVFKVVNLSEPEARKTGKVPKKEPFSQELGDFELRRQAFKRVLQMIGTGSISLMFTLASAGIWWFSGTPPGAFMFQSKAVNMQISESRMQLIKKKADQLYETLVYISYPQAPDTNPEYAEKKIPRKYNLEARPDAGKILNKAAAEQALRIFPKGKIITVYAKDTVNGPFYTMRNSRFTIISAFLIIFTFLGVNGGAIYFLFYRKTLSQIK